MRLVAPLALVLVVACGASSSAAPVTTVPVAPVAASASARPRAPAPARSGVVLFVDSARLRAHPHGARLGPLLATLPGVAALAKRSPGFDPVRDADWLVVTGPDLGILGSRATVIAHLAGDEAKAAQAFGPIAMLDDEHPPVGPVRVRARDVLAPGPTALSQDVARFERPPAAGGAAIWLSMGGEARELRTPLFGDARSLVLRIDALPSADAADARAEVLYDDEPAAGAFVERARARVAHAQAQAFVRLVFRGLVDDVTVEAAGRRGVAKVHARPEQLEAVLNFAEAAAGVQAPAPPPPP